MKWARREASVARDREIDKMLTNSASHVPLDDILRDALVHTEAPRARAHAAEGGAAAHRTAYLRELLALPAVARLSEQHDDVRRAVDDLRRCALDGAAA